MSRVLIVPALALAALAAVALPVAGGAVAESRSPHVDVPREQWMSVAKIAEHFGAQGYDVRSVETEKGRYEIEAVDKDGRRVEIDAHPVTGEILKQKRDD